MKRRSHKRIDPLTIYFYTSEIAIRLARLNKLKQKQVTVKFSESRLAISIECSCALIRIEFKKIASLDGAGN